MYMSSNFPTSLSTIGIVSLFKFASLIRGKWYLIIVLICIFLLLVMLEIFSYVYWPFRLPRLWIACLYPLSTFLLGLIVSYRFVEMLHIFWVLICCWLNTFYLWASCLFLIYDVFLTSKILMYLPSLRYGLYFILSSLRILPKLQWFWFVFFLSYCFWKSLLFYQSLTLRNTTFSLNNISLPSSMLLLLNILVYLKTLQIIFFFSQFIL